MRAEIGYLPLDPHVGVLALQPRAYRRDQIANRPDPPLLRAKIEPKLVERTHERKVYSKGDDRLSPEAGRLNDDYFLNREITYSTIDSTTLSRIEVARGK